MGKNDCLVSSSFLTLVQNAVCGEGVFFWGGGNRWNSQSRCLSSIPTKSTQKKSCQQSQHRSASQWICLSHLHIKKRNTATKLGVPIPRRIFHHIPAKGETWFGLDRCWVPWSGDAEQWKPFPSCTGLQEVPPPPGGSPLFLQNHSFWPLQP